MRRQEIKIIREEFGSALVASSLYNIFTRKNKSDRPVKPEDMMPSMIGKKKTQQEGKTVTQMMAIAKAITKDLGGRVGINNS